MRSFPEFSDNIIRSHRINFFCITFQLSADKAINNLTISCTLGQLIVSLSSDNA